MARVYLHSATGVIVAPQFEGTVFSGFGTWEDVLLHESVCVADRRSRNPIGGLDWVALIDEDMSTTLHLNYVG